MKAKILFKQIFSIFRSKWKVGLLLFFFLSLVFSLVLGINLFLSNIKELTITNVKTSNRIPQAKINFDNFSFDKESVKGKKFLFSDNFRNELLKEYKGSLPNLEKYNEVKKILDESIVGKEKENNNSYTITNIFLENVLQNYGFVEATNIRQLFYKYKPQEMQTPELEIYISQFELLKNSLFHSYETEMSNIMIKQFTKFLENNYSSKKLKLKYSNQLMLKHLDLNNKFISSGRISVINFSDKKSLDLFKYVKDDKFDETINLPRIYISESKYFNHAYNVNQKITLYDKTYSTFSKFDVVVAGYSVDYSRMFGSPRTLQGVIDYYDLMRFNKAILQKEFLSLIVNIKPDFILNIDDKKENADSYEKLWKLLWSSNMLNREKLSGFEEYRSYIFGIPNTYENYSLYSSFYDLANPILGLLNILILIFAIIVIYFLIKEQINSNKKALIFLKCMGIKNIELSIFNALSITLPFILALAVSYFGMISIQKMMWNSVQNDWNFYLNFWKLSKYTIFHYCILVLTNIFFFMYLNSKILKNEINIAHYDTGGYKISKFQLFLTKFSLGSGRRHKNIIGKSFLLSNFSKGFIILIMSTLTFTIEFFGVQFSSSVKESSNSLLKTYYPFFSYSGVSPELFNYTGNEISVEYSSSQTLSDIQNKKNMEITFDMDDNSNTKLTLDGGAFKEMDPTHNWDYNKWDFDGTFITKNSIEKLTLDKCSKVVSIGKGDIIIKYGGRNQKVPDSVKTDFSKRMIEVLNQICNYKTMISKSYDNGSSNMGTNIVFGKKYKSELNSLSYTTINSNVLYKTKKQASIKLFNEDIKKYNINLYINKSISQQVLTKKVIDLNNTDVFIIENKLYDNGDIDLSDYESDDLVEFNVPVISVIGNTTLNEQVNSLIPISTYLNQKPNTFINSDSEKKPNNQFAELAYYIKPVKIIKENPVEGTLIINEDDFMEFVQDQALQMKKIIEKQPDNAAYYDPINEINLATIYDNINKKILSMNKIYDKLNNTTLTENKIPEILDQLSIKFNGYRDISDSNIGKRGNIVSYSQSDEITYSILDFEEVKNIILSKTKVYIDLVKNIMYIFTIITICISIILTDIILNENKKIIILLKSMGYRKYKIINNVMISHIISLIFGTVLAVLSSWWLLKILSPTFEVTLSGPLVFTLSWQYIALVIFAPLLFYLILMISISMYTKKLRPTDITSL